MPELMSIAWRTGPLISRNGVIALVLTCIGSSGNPGSSSPSIAAMITGMYSGLHPAMIALTAMASIVASPLRGGMMPITSSAARPVAAMNASTSSSVAGRIGSPSVQP